MSDKKPEVLTIGFSAGSLFDIQAVEKIYEEEGLKAYIDKLSKMDEKGETFGPGPALGLYLALRNLKDQIPDDVLEIRFGMVSRHSPNHESAPIFRSYRTLIADASADIEISKELDYLSFTDGRSPLKYHKAQGADLVFSTSESAAKEYYENGIAAIYIPNTSAARNLEMYERRDQKIVLVSDFDGVIGDVLSEYNYQNAKLAGEGVNPLEVFRRNERINRDSPMELGPLGNVVKKLGAIVEYYSEQKIEKKIKVDDIPYETIVVTARGGSAFERFNMTQKMHGIKVSQAHLMDGRNKNLILDIIADENKNANILFIDDGKVHFDRALDLKDILAGFVHNDLTVGKIIPDGKLSDALRGLKEKSDKVSVKEIIEKSDKVSVKEIIGNKAEGYSEKNGEVSAKSKPRAPK
jgi:hypothetical protein